MLLLVAVVLGVGVILEVMEQEATMVVMVVVALVYEALVLMV